METRANYLVVVSFVIVILAATAGGAILLLNLHPFPDTRAYYDIYFQGSVVGLKVEAPVSLSGIPIGNVRKVQLDPADPCGPRHHRGPKRRVDQDRLNRLARREPGLRRSEHQHQRRQRAGTAACRLAGPALSGHQVAAVPVLGVVGGGSRSTSARDLGDTR